MSMNLDKNKIFNGSSQKILIREFNNLKKNFTKMNAIKYKSFYENQPLSFLLENSQYIFVEPYRGYNFYKNILEHCMVPFDTVQAQKDKIYNYLMENVDRMSNEQKIMYESLYGIISDKFNSMRNSINLYENIVNNRDYIYPIYDIIYEKMVGRENSIDIGNIIDPRNNINIMDAVNIISEFPDHSHKFMEYVDDIYYDNPATPDDYVNNACTSNILYRMMKDKYISEKVKKIPNVNLRHKIMTISSIKDIDTIDNIVVEKVRKDKDTHVDSDYSLSKIYESMIYPDSQDEYNSFIKMNKLLCEKAILGVNIGFSSIDYLSFIDDKNSIVERACIDNPNAEKIPYTSLENIEILKSLYESVDGEIEEICEKYFSSGGGPGRVVARSIGSGYTDDAHKKHDSEKTEEKIKIKTHQTKSTFNDDEDEKDISSEDNNDDDANTEKEDNIKNDNEDEDIKENEKREEKKRRKTEKYANMSLDSDEFKSITEKKEIQEPEKRNIFRRIQNKALDINIKAKKRTAESKRLRTDIKNAGKAVTKIPMNVASSVKKTMEEWDQADDDRRKEYMIKEGSRKKYFRILRLCILHYGAFAINPVLNIILFICHKTGKSKDERIRNELTRELKAEIDVVKEKIEDARSAGDNKKKYELMRIKEKLDAEYVRVSANAKSI